MEMNGEQRSSGSDESVGFLIGDSDTLQNHRALKRELCFTRTAIVFLLTMCAGFCTLVYFQQVPGCKNEEHHIRPNATTPAAQAAVGCKPAAMQTRPFASLRLGHPDYSSTTGSKNITWMKNRRLSEFSLGDDKTSLIVPESGFYQIALQITYKQRKEVKEVTLHHVLNHYTKGYGKTIVLLSVFEAVSLQKEWLKSVYSTNIFRLQKEDKLWVETHNYKLLYTEEKDAGTATFLTAHLVEAVRDDPDDEETDT